MSVQYEIQILRSKLIAMTRLTQRAVDYSIKAMQLGRPELCRVIHTSRKEIGAIRCWIASHGRELLAAEITGTADSRFVCAALRISEALEVSCEAAFEIVQQSETRLAAEWMPVSAELEAAGQFVNSLLRLCVVSLLKGEVRHAKAVLDNGGVGESPDLAVHLTQSRRTQGTGSAPVRFELAVIQSLDRIAGQTRQIADAILLWLEEAGQENGAGRGAAHKPPRHTARVASETRMVPLSETDMPGKVLFFGGAMPPRPALRPNSPDDCCLTPRGLADAVSSEDFSRARLISLQQRVCELLVKNQQLRMALMAEKAESHQDQLC